MDHETSVANAISMCSQPLIGKILHIFYDFYPIELVTWYGTCYSKCAVCLVCLSWMPCISM